MFVKMVPFLSRVLYFEIKLISRNALLCFLNIDVSMQRSKIYCLYKNQIDNGDTQIEVETVSMSLKNIQLR